MLLLSGDLGIYIWQVGTVLANVLLVYHLHQGAANFLCKYFKLCKQLLNFDQPL